MDILVTAPIALRATAESAGAHQAELLKRYARSYLQKATEIECYAQKAPGSCEGKGSIVLCREITKGGIEAALWEAAEELKAGLRVELREVPIRQETVEVFNELDMDPYILDSYGSWLLFVNDGAAVLAELRSQGFSDAALIGYTTKDRKRVMIYSGVERFLLPPKRYL
ncbi:MAG: hypothetical protein IKO10_10275 [Lachnospiraceae bacterium]|nr:hypothetical protein [Lachnospiraceae bacterium]